MHRFCAGLLREDEGQDLIEYVLLVSVVSLAVLLGATALGTGLNGWFDEGRIWLEGRSFPS